MITNPKALFVSILKAQQADCVCDIGSRDGDQALLFRHLLPEATVMAFEANPINFEVMRANQTLSASRIDLFPFAVSNQRGTAQFHITDVDYSDPTANRGTSSLFRTEGNKVMKSVEVETHRIDEFILARCPGARRIGLWIDVEGAEHSVLEGITAIRDRIVAVHVETTNEPRWDRQQPLRALKALMATTGFVACGANFGAGESEWGDVVFIRREVADELGARFLFCKFKGLASHWLRANHIAVLLKGRWPWLYRTLRRCYIKFGT